MAEGIVTTGKWQTFVYDENDLLEEHQLTGNINIDIREILHQESHRDDDEKAKNKSDSFLQSLDEKVWINMENDTHRQVCSFAESFVECLLQKVRTNHPELPHFKLFNSGSFYSQLKVGLPYEFDYMLEILDLQDSDEQGGDSGEKQYKARLFNPRYTKTLYKLETTNEKWIQMYSKTKLKEDQKWHEISTLLLTQHIYTALVSELAGMETSWNIVKTPESTSSPAFCTALRYRDVGVLIDIVPCVKLPKSSYHILPPLKENAVKFLSDLKCFNSIDDDDDIASIEENIYKRLFLVCRMDALQNNCFRLSLSHVEKAAYAKVNTRYKSVIRIVKYLIHQFHLPTNTSSALLSYDSDYKPISYDSTTEEIFGCNSVILSYHAAQIFWAIIITLMQQLNIADLPMLMLVNLFLEGVSRTMYANVPKYVREIDNFDHVAMWLNTWLFDDYISLKTVVDFDEEVNYPKMCVHQIQLIKEFLRRTIICSDLDAYRLVNRQEGACPLCWGKYFEPMMKRLENFYHGERTILVSECEIHKYLHNC